MPLKPWLLGAGAAQAGHWALPSGAEGRTHHIPLLAWVGSGAEGRTIGGRT